jgi:hypothetical protein
VLRGPAKTVDVGAPALGTVRGAGVGLATPTGAPTIPAVACGVRVDVEAGEVLGLSEDAVAGRALGSAGDPVVDDGAVAGEASGPADGVVVGETSGLEEGPAAEEGAVAGEASTPTGDAMAGVDVPTATGEEAGSEDGAASTAEEVGGKESAPAVEEAGSEDGGAPAAEVESGAPAKAEGSRDGGTAAAMASGIDVAITDTASAFAPVAAAGLPARVVAEAAAVSAVETPDSEAGHVTIPPLAAPALATLSCARAVREGCGVLPPPPLGLLLGWPSAVAVRAQCVASAL